MTNPQPNAAAGPPALRAAPMNTDPIEFPRVAAADLSDDARLVWRAYDHYVDHDAFSGARRGYLSAADRQAFVPTERILSAIAELEHFGFARYNAEYKTLSKRKVHPSYTWAQGRGSQIIKVSVFAQHPDDARVVAVLVGGDIESRDTRSGSVPSLTVQARHENGTDFEHSPSSTAVLSLSMPTQPVFSGLGRVTFTAVLTEARLYPLGTDLFSVNDPDTAVGKICDRCAEPHPFLPYQPPALELGGPMLALVETRPFRPYLVRDPAA